MVLSGLGLRMGVLLVAKFGLSGVRDAPAHFSSELVGDARDQAQGVQFLQLCFDLRPGRFRHDLQLHPAADVFVPSQQSFGDMGLRR